MIFEKQYYLDLFHTDAASLEALMTRALDKGADWVDFFFENNSTTTLMLRDSEVANGSFNTDYGVGIRVLKGEKTGYAYCESTDPVSLSNAVDAACAVAGGASAGTSIATESGYVPRLYKGRPNPAADRYPFERDWRKEPTGKFVPPLEKLEALIRAGDSRVDKLSALFQGEISDILMYNSHGELKYETRPMGTIAANTVFRSDTARCDSSVSRSFRMGAEMITDGLLEEMARQSVRNVDDKLHAIRPKGGSMSVVLGAGPSGILLHEAMGHSFEADFIRKGQSIFTESMGKRICPEGITIVDDGTIKGNRGSVNFDDEGVPAQRTVMVEDGILTSFLHDRISARHFGVQPTGNGRRESFRFHPIPRMRATYMEGGTCSKDDVISSVKKGIYVDEFSNGQVKIGEGDFTFYVKSGYLIEDGRLTAPVKDINIIGNGPEVLADIRAVCDDPLLDPSAWTCGKTQSVPVSCGMPTVLVGKLTVGGQ